MMAAKNVAGHVREMIVLLDRLKRKNRKNSSSGAYGKEGRGSAAVRLPPVPGE